MKLLTILSLMTMSLMASPPQKVPFQHQIYLEYGGKGAATGVNPQNAAAFTDNSALWTIPANTVIEKLYFVVDTAITGTTDIDLGDSGSSNGLFDGSNWPTLTSTGMKGHVPASAGSYLVSAAARYYPVASALAIDVTGTNSAGKARIIVEGQYLGSN